MKIYNYSKQNGEFLRESEARLDPLESKIGNEVYLIPSCATKEQPPALKANQVAVFSGGAWQVKKDFRGTVYYTGNEVFKIVEIGTDPPAGSTTDPPPQDFSNPFFNGYNWIEQQMPPQPEPEVKTALSLTPEIITELTKAKDFTEFKDILNTLSAKEKVNK